MRLHIQPLHAYLILVLTLLLFTIPEVAADIVVNTYEPTPTTSAGTGYVVSPGMSQLAICACSVATDSIQVTNPGTATRSFTVSVNRRDVGLSDTSFSLPGGSTKILLLEFAPACGTRDSYDLTVTITSDQGIKSQVRKQVTIGQCVNFQATVTPSTDLAVPCEPIEYEIALYNTGTFADTFTIDFGDYDAFVSDPVKSELLVAGEQANFTPTLALACGLSGNISIPITITSDHNNLKAQYVQDLVIQPDYGYTISAEERSYRICQEVGRQIPITISNEGIDNIFTLSINGPSYVSLNQTTLQLDSGDEATILLTATPASAFIGQEATATIAVESLYGGIRQELPLQINTASCYSVGIGFAQDPWTSCPGEATDQVTITNDGAFNERISLSLEGADFLDLEDNSIRLDAGDSDVLDISGVFPDEDQTLQATLIATLENGLSFSQPLTITSHSRYACYGLAVAKDAYTITTDESDLRLRFMNQGSQDTSYRLSMDAPAWITRDTENSPLRFDLPPRGAQYWTLYLDTEGVDYGTYTVNIDVDVPDADYTYTIPISITLREKTFIEKAASSVFHYFYDDPTGCRDIQFYLIILVILSIVAFCIARAKTPRYRYKLGKRIRQQIVPLIVLITAFVAIVLLIVLATGLPFTPRQQANLTTSEPDMIKWAQGTTKTLNLSLYFTDPDLDILSFEASGNDQIQITFSGDLVVMKAPEDFAGTEEVRFIAIDEEGATTRSPRFTLEVVPVPRLDLGGYLLFWCKQINLLLILILFFFIYSLFIVLNPRYRKEQLELPAFEKRSSETKNQAKSAPKAKPKQARARASRKRSSRRPSRSRK